MSEARATTDSTRTVSTWAPLRNGLFRTLWLAVLVSNVASWMQTVGAQWLLVGQPNASILVALVQTVDYLPDLLFGLVGGVLADTFDRRRLLMVVQGFLVVAGAALAALTITGEMPPALLLTFTFLIGGTSVLTLPAYQALVPDLVPRGQLHSAAALSSISINVARAIGPAIAGVVIARAGVGAVFALNTAMYALFLVVLVAWHPPANAPKLPEPFVSALRAGGRYVRYAPVVRRILLRSALFLVPGSALWALLPLIASRRLAQGADGYGLLLGALGVGAIAGAVALPRIRARLSINALLATSGLVYALVLAIVVLISNAAVILIVLLPAGVAWMAFLSTVNAELQLFLPAWVRARGLSVYQMVLFGAQGFGALFWGILAAPAGLVTTFLIAATVMIAGVATMRIWPIIDTSGMDRSTVRYWPEPTLAPNAADPDDGPVVVKIVYAIAPEKEAPFFKAMAQVRLSRLRTGATQWGLFRNGETPRQFVELYVVSSWEEHLRQHADRLTGTDQKFEEAAEAFSDHPTDTSHLIAVEIPEIDC